MHPRIGAPRRHCVFDAFSPLRDQGRFAGPGLSGDLSQQMGSRWEALLKDRDRSLSERLLIFYREYTAVIVNPEWIRIFMFAGMKSLDINARYFALLREHILVPILLELRFEQGAPPLQENHVSSAESYGISILVPLETCVEDAIGGFIAGTPEIVEQSSPLETPAMAVPKKRPATSERSTYRMSPAARERNIVTGAIKFFAEYGTDGDLRKLASSLGITHPLLYRFFPRRRLCWTGLR
jgi:hypothetical protein